MQTQLSLFDREEQKFVNLREASKWASKYLNRNVLVSNISYLLQYGKIKKYGKDGTALVSIDELKNYYDSFSKERQWKKILGEDLNWHLSFVEYKESERTKHVHRLHPYKGKFIPQLVEYFLDSHTDEFKKEIFFKEGDIVLDPFCGSGTTLVQANELNMHAIGIDISSFNALISNTKIQEHNFILIKDIIRKITANFKEFQKYQGNLQFDEKLTSELNTYNSRYFPSPDFKIKVRNREVNEKEYSKNKEEEFLKIYNNLIEQYKIKIRQDANNSFLDKWFIALVRQEINFMIQEIDQISDTDIKNLLSIILSRTVRSCRATTHADLATLKEPVLATYYCKKHGKICKPVFSISGWWQRYTIDTLNRLQQFDKVRKNTFQICLTGDSRTINLDNKIEKYNPYFSDLLDKKKIRGIFSSPPYVGLIDYHDQHAYAYELFGFKRRDELEIGPLSSGQGREARQSYIKGIADVLNNCKRYLTKSYDIFLVANDKYNFYQEIAKLADMKIVNQFKRPVLNRVEKNRSAYAETIFHLKSE